MDDDFETWLAQVAAEDDGGFVEADLPAPWRRWMKQTFRDRGAISAKELNELALGEHARLAAASVEAARKLIPAVIADAASVGISLDVQLELDEWANLRVLVRYESGSSYREASNGGIRLPANDDAALLASLADEVQEVSMERDQVNCFVWPVCTVHQLGGHATVVGGRAVWSCNGADGHLIAPVGELTRSR